jgi:hypothetical protein
MRGSGRVEVGGQPGSQWWAGTGARSVVAAAVLVAVLVLGAFAAAGGAAALTPNEAYVTRLYLDLLGRSPSAGELPTWTGQLSGGASRAPVVSSLTSSVEARTRLVRLTYLALLHRTPTPVEESQTVNRLAAGGHR